jgi:hypothetical protein
MNRLPDPEAMRARAADEFTEARRRRAMQWAQTPEGRACIESYRTEATGRVPMTPQRRAEREDETIEALIGLALLCIAWAALDALFRYLTTGG